MRSKRLLTVGLLLLSAVAFAQTSVTTLAFRTQPGATGILLGQSRQLGTISVDHYERIRIVAAERARSAGPVRIRLMITEGNERVGLLDTITVQPNSQVTRVYEVPGRTLTIYADALGTGSGTSAVDVFIYGFTE